MDYAQDQRVRRLGKGDDDPADAVTVDDGAELRGTAQQPDFTARRLLLFLVRQQAPCAGKLHPCFLVRSDALHLSPFIPQCCYGADSAGRRSGRPGCHGGKHTIQSLFFIHRYNNNVNNMTILVNFIPHLGVMCGMNKRVSCSIELLDPDRADLELRNLADRIAGGIGQKVGRRFREMEGK